MAATDPTSALAQHLATAPELPYKLAVLIYLYDHDDRLLMLHRLKPPNPSMCSPIGGKIEFHKGESPHECALREISEEAGLTLDYADIRLCGIVSERAYQGEHHWMIYLFESVKPIDAREVTRMHFDEGRLEWIARDRVALLPLPETDRRVMWPNVQKHRGGFFMVQIDCTVQPFDFRIVESSP